MAMPSRSMNSGLHSGIGQNGLRQRHNDSQKDGNKQKNPGPKKENNRDHGDLREADDGDFGFVVFPSFARLQLVLVGSFFIYWACGEYIEDTFFEITGSSFLFHYHVYLMGTVFFYLGILSWTRVFVETCKKYFKKGVKSKPKKAGKSAQKKDFRKPSPGFNMDYKGINRQNVMQQRRQQESVNRMKPFAGMDEHDLNASLQQRKLLRPDDVVDIESYERFAEREEKLSQPPVETHSTRYVPSQTGFGASSGGVTHDPMSLGPTSHPHPQSFNTSNQGLNTSGATTSGVFNGSGVGLSNSGVTGGSPSSFLGNRSGMGPSLVVNGSNFGTSQSFTYAQPFRGEQKSQYDIGHSSMNSAYPTPIQEPGAAFGFPSASTSGISGRVGGSGMFGGPTHTGYTPGGPVPGSSMYARGGLSTTYGETGGYGAQSLRPSNLFGSTGQHENIRPYNGELKALIAEDKVVLDDAHSHEYYDHASTQLYKTLNVTDIDDWAQNIRAWFSHTLVKDFVRDFDKNDKELVGIHSWTAQYFAAHKQPMPPLLKQATTPPKIIHMIQQCAEFYRKNCSPDQLAQVEAVLSRRVLLDQQLTAINSTNPQYVLERLRELNKQRYIQEFVYDGGGTWDGSKWAAPLPCDAEILMSLFCNKMDSYLYPIDFTKDHYIPYEEKKVPAEGSKKEASSATKPIRDIAIFHTKKTPPYFSIRCAKSNDKKPTTDCNEWAIKPGRDNVFHTLAMFAYYVHNYLDGKFRGVPLREHKLGFLENVL